VSGKEREAAERAFHLKRVCAGFPTRISEEGARRLVRMFGRDREGQEGKV